MGFRFKRSIKIAPGVRLNVGKKSVGVSAGVRGARISTNTRTGTRATISAPGTGLSYSTKIGGSSARASPSATIPAPSLSGSPLTSLQLSANTISWPCVCPCCGVKLVAPTGALQTPSGVSVITMAVNTFSPSYCQTCVNHHALWRQAEAISKAPDTLLFWIVAAPIAFVTWFIALAIVAASINFGLAFLIVTTVIVSATIYVVSNFKKIEATRASQKAGILQRAANQRKPTCTCNGPAVQITSSHGSLRQFSFSNEPIAKAFAQMNSKKLVY